MPTAFEVEWNRRYSGIRPAGYALRHGHAEHWVRFHALPQSKRYAEDDIERACVLHRMNTLAMEVLGGEPCWVVELHWPGEQGDAGLATLGLPLAYRFDGNDDEPCGEGVWSVHARQTTWGARSFDVILEAIANERAFSTLWFSRATAAVFAPYDGGVDLFLPTAADVDRLKGSYADWLSTHPSGL